MDVHEVVRERYGAIASGQQQSCCGSDSSSAADCGCKPQLYDPALIADLPVDVTGLSLG